MARDARLHDGPRQRFVGGEVEVGEDDLPRTHERPFDRQRLLDLDDQVARASRRRRRWRRSRRRFG